MRGNGPDVTEKEPTDVSPTETTPTTQPEKEPTKQALSGLSTTEVEQRIASGDVNVDANIKTRSIKRIFYDNICTLFNAINVILALFVLFTGSYRNMLFMIVIICNVAIGIVQEIRSKKITDRLSIVASSKAEVMRNGEKVEVPNDQLVRDDIIILGRGDQVPADSVVVSGTCAANESLLTGESNLIEKAVGSQLMSGSFVSSGLVYARIEHVGPENYAAKISEEAKQEKKVNSEIMNSLNGIIKFVSFLIFPLGALLFLREFFIGHLGLNEAILSTVAAMVGMIPEGLILLTSTVLAVSVIRLAQSKVLVQQLYCIETLARVDTLCLDKTGTITTGAMKLESVEPLDEGGSTDELNLALSSLAFADEDPNETAKAITDYYEKNHEKNPAGEPLKPKRMIPFSSDKKWSGATFENGSAYVMGAAQFVLKDDYAAIAPRLEGLAAHARVIVVARVDGFTDSGDMEGKPQPLGFAVIHDEIRPTAAQTIAYFKEQGVTVNVISGDDPKTVSSIAQTVGIEGADKYVDATTLKTDEQIADAMQRYHVFGRVRPEQKKAFVIALQQAGHIVAMTGDGVNDTLALKQSDCSVAMASGSDAARNVAQIVLVDNDFSSMPKVVAEGRRSINNLQRSASLFLVKTLLSMTLAIIFIFMPWGYPFQPIQMTLVSAFTIGLPSFVLALEPNKDRIKGKFLENVIVRSIPGAVCAVVTLLLVNILGYGPLGLSSQSVSTLCVLLTSWVGLMLIIRLSWPFTPIRIGLIIVVVGGTVFCATVLHSLFIITPLTGEMWILFLSCCAGIAIVFNLLYSALDRWHNERLAKLV